MIANASVARQNTCGITGGDFVFDSRCSVPAVTTIVNHN